MNWNIVPHVAPAVKVARKVHVHLAKSGVQPSSLATLQAASFALRCGDRKLARIFTRLALGNKRGGTQ